MYASERQKLKGSESRNIQLSINAFLMCQRLVEARPEHPRRHWAYRSIPVLSMVVVACRGEVGCRLPRSD